MFSFCFFFVAFFVVDFATRYPLSAHSLYPLPFLLRVAVAVAVVIIVAGVVVGVVAVGRDLRCRRF